MHEFRTAILSGEVPASPDPVSRKERCRRRGGPTLVDIAIPREERRMTDQRREDRFQDLVERATIVFRRKRSLVRIVNVSAGGAMVESGIVPRIGEAVELEIDGFGRLEGAVRWVKQGRIGIDLGESAIEVG